jgi:hypothetical protein
MFRHPDSSDSEDDSGVPELTGRVSFLTSKGIKLTKGNQSWLHKPLERGRFCIYVGISSNGKMYVGQHLAGTGKKTTSCWNARIHTKIKDKKCRAVWNAIQKYGFGDFEWFILHEGCESDTFDADTAEIHFIELLNTISPGGYNIRFGGSRGRLHPESIAKYKATMATPAQQEKKKITSKEVANRPEIKAALSKRMKGNIPVKPSADVEIARRKKISSTTTGSKRGPMPDHVKLRISQALKGRTLPPEVIDKMKKAKRTQKSERSMSNASTLRWQDPEYRSKRRNKVLEKRQIQLDACLSEKDRTSLVKTFERVDRNNAFKKQRTTQVPDTSHV